MANWTITSHFIYGDVEKVKKVYDQLKMLYDEKFEGKKHPEASKNWIGHLMEMNNIEEPKGVYGRSFVNWVDEYSNEGFWFDTEDAWGPAELLSDIFHKIHTEDKPLYHCYECIEEGCEVYVYHNEGEQDIYPSSPYYADSSKGCDYFDDVASAIRYYNELFDKNVSEELSYDDFRKYLNENELDDREFFTFNKFVEDE